MLQRLELVGFKSFAEKTRFEFAPGITAIVGPNGSGKSNVVDAVKWVLGEQSAKALRGGEMTDVIFNGSSTRRSVGLAEVSLTFDNSRQILASDALEVQITRRVYRDGEGEYLVNGQPARLKDIKDLFLGSGAGHGAYSVIEQGRVDALLMASNKDRRVIFEEAAGISRFKAKKLETLRKLDRVDADLTRVKDILQELDKQLRTLRHQAAKAVQHRERSAELRRLRVGVARREYAELAESVARETARLAGLKAAADEVAVAASDAELSRLDAALRQSDEHRRTCEGELAALTHALAGFEAAAKHERIRATGLEVELHRLGKQRVEARERMRRIEAEAAECAAAADRLERGFAAEEGRVAALDAVLAGDSGRIRDLQQFIGTERETGVELAARLARVQGQAERLRADLERSAAERGAKERRIDVIARELAASDAAVAEWASAEAGLVIQLEGARQNRGEYVSYRQSLYGKAESIRQAMDQRREHRSALIGRADVLETWERNSEGLGAGVREVLRRRDAGDPLLTAALGGLVAEIFSAPRELAPLVDLALGEWAQSFVLTADDSQGEVAAALTDVPGRVGLIPLRPNAHGVSIGRRLSEFVGVEPAAMNALAEQLLGGVVVVESLADALAEAKRAPTLRFITTAGELLEPDGRLTLGPANGLAGIVSRKSELRELREQITACDGEIAALEADAAATQRQIDGLNPPLRALETEIAALERESAAHRDRLRERRHEAQQLGQARAQLERDLELLDASRREWAIAADAASREMLDLDAARAESEHRLADATAALDRAGSERDAQREELVRAQIAWERQRERLAAIRTRGAQLRQQREQERRGFAEIDAMRQTGRARREECSLAILRATASAAERCGPKERAGRELARASARQMELRRDYDATSKRSQWSREASAERTRRAHTHELLVRDLVHRRDTIAARIADDYGLDLAVPSTEEEPHDLPDDETADDRITALRAELSKLGGANPESLEELEGLETRERDLRAQHDDLADSHRKLLDIIGQLNLDSRKLFVETLATVRGHFQEMFRKLFGGGQADVVLEDGADPLESGIEITARPPGKELGSISLLSGGERTLTAIALLLAIFRSKPSPFCLLDEVDAALDEANTARLAAALGDFLDRSQFIVITHKKRTMAVADVLYGVTMQESGVSKQVSVRFEDWPEESELRAAA